MTCVDSFDCLIPDYDTFVFDIWGVVHDGVRPFPGIRPTLEKLRAAGKHVVFLTNMSQLSAEVETHLAAMNVPRNLYDFALSSGQAACDYINTLAKSGVANFFHVNDDVSFRKHLTHLNINFVDDCDLADFLLVARGDLRECVSRNTHILESAIAQNKPLICANPDTGVMIDGKFVERPGSLNKTYEDLGGNVLAFGKPHPSIYESLNSLIEHQLDIKTRESRTLMIGDSLETDIIGARHHGWDAMLVLTGVTAHKNGWLQGLPDANQLQILQTPNAPTHVFRGFTD